MRIMQAMYRDNVGTRKTMLVQPGDHAGHVGTTWVPGKPCRDNKRTIQTIYKQRGDQANLVGTTWGPCRQCRDNMGTRKSR